MDIQKEIKYWIDLADRDYPLMDHLFDSKYYLWCLYIGHLNLERLLKGLYTQVNEDKPPKIHNLVVLAEKSNLELSNEKKLIFDHINEFQIEARYADAKFELYKKCDYNYTLKYLNFIKENIKWIKSLIK